MGQEYRLEYRTVSSHTRDNWSRAEALQSGRLVAVGEANSGAVSGALFVLLDRGGLRGGRRMAAAPTLSS